MKRSRVVLSFAAVTLALSVAALVPLVGSSAPANPTLTEKRFQASQLAAFFAVDADLARQWVPPAFDLAIDAQTGKATGALVVMDYPTFCLLRAPNTPAFAVGTNVAPAAIVHFWFVLNGPFENVPVPGAFRTADTAYYYDAVDLVTSQVEHDMYRRSGRAAVLVSDITLVDDVQTQTAEITFLDGSQITVSATAPAALPKTLLFGGNLWQWHVGGPTEMGDNRGARPDPEHGSPSNVNTTRGQYLAYPPGTPNATQAAIHSDPGTLFVECFGATDVTALRATFFKLNNIALNWSRGALAWTDKPPVALPPPPTLPIVP